MSTALILSNPSFLIALFSLEHISTHIPKTIFLSKLLPRFPSRKASKNTSPMTVFLGKNSLLRFEGCETQAIILRGERTKKEIQRWRMKPPGWAFGSIYWPAQPT